MEIRAYEMCKKFLFKQKIISYVIIWYKNITLKSKYKKTNNKLNKYNSLSQNHIAIIHIKFASSLIKL